MPKVPAGLYIPSNSLRLELYRLTTIVIFNKKAPPQLPSDYMVEVGR